jgi:hypothetical protein
MGPFSHPGVPRLLLAIAVVAAALALHVALWRLILRVMRDRAFAEELRRYCRWPARAVVVLGAVLLVFSATRPRPSVRGAAPGAATPARRAPERPGWPDSGAAHREPIPAR